MIVLPFFGNPEIRASKRVSRGVKEVKFRFRQQVEQFMLPCQHFFRRTGHNRDGKLATSPTSYRVNQMLVACTKSLAEDNQRAPRGE